MNASDHLSGVQFMPIEKAGRLISNDFSQNMLDDDGVEVRHVPYEDVVFGTSDKHYEDLKKSIAEHGIQQPLEVKGRRLMEGHHRYTIAKELGMSHVPVTEWRG